MNSINITLYTLTAEQMQNRLPLCPMLPSFEDNHEQNQYLDMNAQMSHHNCQAYHESHQVNESMHHSTDKTFENVSQTQHMTQPPKKTFIGIKTIVAIAQTAISIQNKNFIASPKSSIHQNECPSTDSTTMNNHR